MSPLQKFIISYVLIAEKRNMVLYREVIEVDLNKYDEDFFTYFKEDETYIHNLMETQRPDLVIVKVEKL